MWTYDNPVRIRFGVVSLDGIGELIRDRAYCLVTYDEAIFQDTARRIAKIAGPDTITIDNVIPNPDFHTLTESCARFAAARPTPVPAPVTIATLSPAVMVSASPGFSFLDPADYNAPARPGQPELDLCAGTNAVGIGLLRRNPGRGCGPARDRVSGR